MAFVRRHAFKIAVLALCAAMAGYLMWERSASSGLPVLKAAPDYELTGLDGTKEKLSDSDGQVRIFYFFFTNCPDFCPTTTALMSDVQDQLKAKGDFGSRVSFHWITIDPDRDSAAAMTEYADAHGADRAAGWSFLRGESQATVDVAKRFGLLVNNAGGTDALVHQDKLILVDGKGRIRKYIEGSGEESQEQIMADIELALKG